MAFIKTQKIVCDDSGKIISGSASIVDTIYGNFGTYHAKHKTRERLGRVIALSDDKKSSIFLSPTRGLVEYDVADSLEIEIESLVLDAGYVSKELIEAIHIGTGKTMIGRMPARRGYPYDS